LLNETVRRQRLPMAWGVEIKNPADGSCEEMLLLSIGYYLLPRGAAIRLYEQPAWCRGCGKFVRAEFLSALEDIDAQMAKYGGKAAETRRQLTGWLYRFGLKSRRQLLHELSVWEEAVAEEEMRREWRLKRQSPPRCLRCGSMALHLPPSDEEYPHPSGKGRVQVAITSHVSLAVDANEYYSAEGLRIEGVQAPA
jgi:hypothetical protein